MARTNHLRDDDTWWLVNTCTRFCSSAFHIHTFLGVVDDIYELYFKNGEKLEKYKFACIPNYKTSVMMNSLFRTIKENKNLDLLEESDDEEEFENMAIDKFVNLEKEIKMKCVFIKKFDSWQPIERSKNEISPRREIICYKKNKK